MTVTLDRLARAVHLSAVKLAPGRYRVAGGASAHVVDLSADVCDCADFALRGAVCKHLLAARLRAGDPEALQALRALVPLPRRRRSAARRAVA